MCAATKRFYEQKFFNITTNKFKTSFTWLFSDKFQKFLLNLKGSQHRPDIRQSPNREKRNTFV